MSQTLFEECYAFVTSASRGKLGKEVLGHRRGQCRFYHEVIQPHQQRCANPDSRDGPPHLCGALHDFPEVMHQPAAEPSSDERSDSDGHEREAHVRSLLARREPGAKRIRSSAAKA